MDKSAVNDELGGLDDGCCAVDGEFRLMIGCAVESRLEAAETVVCPASLDSELTSLL